MSASVVGGATACGLWLSVADLAEARGISKQAVRKRLAAFGPSVSVTKDTKGLTLVNAAEYDVATGDIGDTLRTAFAQSAPPPGAADPIEPTSSSILTAERARREGYEAEIKRLQLEELQKKVVRVDEVQAAMVRAGETFVRRLDQLHTRAADLASAVAKEGVVGARAFLKALAHDLRAQIARDLELLAAGPADGTPDVDGGDTETRHT